VGRKLRSHAGRAWLVILAVVLATSSACTGSSHPAPAPDPSGSPASVVRLRVTFAGYRLPVPVQREVAVASGTGILLAGGLDAGGASADGVFVLNPSTGKLTVLGALPQPVHDAAGAVIGGRLLVFGGGAATVSDLVQTFDPRSRKASVLGHLPRPLADLQAVSDGTTVFLIGGYDGRRARPEILATSDGRSFHKVATLSEGLRYPATALVDGRIIVAGGETDSGPSDRVLSVDPTTGRVAQLGPLPAAVSQAAAFTLGGRVFVAGGVGSGGAASARIWNVDPARGSVSAAGRLPVALADTAIAAIGKREWLLGGWDRTALSQVSVARLVTVAPARPSPSPSSTSDAADATVRPFAGLMVIADRGNNRLLVVNAAKDVVWRYPSRNLPPPPFRFYFPDDAFWVHGGHAILVNEEENHVIVEIAYPSGRWLWSYGHAGVPGSGAGFLHQPDDVYPYPGGGVVVADALNCRLLFFDARGRPTRQIGRTGNCTPGLPLTIGYPNGDTPLRSGDLLVSELNGGRVVRISPAGTVRWSLHVPGVPVPSDPQRLDDGTYLVVDYQTPGRIVRFTRSGRVLWSFAPSSGRGMLQHPSLGVPLPNGLVAACDDYGHRVVLIDPKTNRIVWQFGRQNQPGRGHGLLRYPDGLDVLFPGGVIPLHVDFPTATTRRGRP